jgi:hypothetical protein
MRGCLIALVWLRSTRVLNFGQNLICVRRRFDTISPRSYLSTCPTRPLGHTSALTLSCRCTWPGPLSVSSCPQIYILLSTAVPPPLSIQRTLRTLPFTGSVERQAQPLYLESPLKEDTPQIFIYVDLSESKRRV